MSTILQALRETEGGKDRAAELPVAVDEQRRRRRLVAAGVGVLIACVLSAAMMFSRRTTPPEPSRATPLRGRGLAPAAPVPAPPPVARVEPPRARVGAEALDHPMATARPTPPVAEPMPSAPPQPSHATAPGGPAVELTALRYSPSGASTVTLSIGGAAPVTLRQGDAVNGIEVQLILQQMVYLRHGGNVFAIDAPR